MKCEQKKNDKREAPNKNQKRNQIKSSNLKKGREEVEKFRSSNSCVDQVIFLYWKWRKQFCRSGFLKTQKHRKSKTENQNHLDMQIREEK